MLEAILTLGLALQGALPEIELKDDLVITESVRIKPGTYRIPDKGEPGILRVKGDHILVMLDEVTILGAAEDQERDTFTGTGMVVEGNENIVHGGAFHGFRVGVEVNGGENHWLMGLDVGGNFARRLSSTPEKEDESDWLRPHGNDDGEWAKNYGAGIRVRNAKGVRIVGARGHGSQNGILLEGSSGCLVRGCDFSFNSGWGLALWRSSDNRVEANEFNWCVRGYSHGVYDRGQDSAGILVFEQCNRNRFIGNSATHSGDGFFLYAGHETTKKTGEGGSNDNVVEGNDFSHAVANGIEATFSTGNRFVGNRLEDCNYGIWAGYSRKSVFERNLIRNCTHAGVAIEHGSENEIRGNLIENSRNGVELWWDEDKEFIESVYGEKNRTDSADTVIEGNVIRGGAVGVLIRASTNIKVTGNLIEDAATAFSTRDQEDPVEFVPATEPLQLDLGVWSDPPGARRGRQYILVHEWGPYDFTSPRLHPSRVEGRARARFHVLGAAGDVTVEKVEGNVLAVVRRDQTGIWIEVAGKPDANSYLPFSFTAKVGETELEGAGILLNAFWMVKHWQWEKDPREDEAAFTALLATPPLVSRRVRHVDFPWQAGGPGGEVQPDRFATLAETKVDLPAGEYELITVSDDGVRLYVDGNRVVDNWTHHASTEDKARLTLKEGRHTIRIEHFELSGWSRLSFRLRRVEE